MDAQGAFVVTVPLSAGDNSLTLTITDPSGQQVASATKTVDFDSTFSIGGLELLYVDATSSNLNGTVVVDVGENDILGIIPNEHVVGISPAGNEVYMADRNVFSTSSGQLLRTLAFSEPIAKNGFVVSPDGTRLYSRNEVLDVASNTLLAPLPVDITSGASFDGAPIPGGPAISPDGSKIYSDLNGQNAIYQIDVATGAVTQIGTFGYLLSDLAVTPDGHRVLASGYAFGTSVIQIYDPSNDQSVGTLFGGGDFAGQMAFIGPTQVAVGDAGNPANGGGGVIINNLSQGRTTQAFSIPLADDLTASPAGNQLFVSAGDSLGVDELVADQNGQFAVQKAFFLGINRYVVSSGTPSNDQIASLFFKPAPVDHFLVSTPAKALVGNSFSVTVTAQDQYGNTAVGYDGFVHFTSSDGAAVLPANATLTDGVGTFTVTLQTPGNQTIAVNDTVSSSLAGASGSIAVEAPLTAQGVTVDTTEGTTLTGTVATFTDADPNGAVGDYTATIVWGDGATTSGTITTASGGGFEVTGSYAYAEEGTQSITVTVLDEGGSTARRLAWPISATRPSLVSPRLQPPAALRTWHPPPSAAPPSATPTPAPRCRTSG